MSTREAARQRTERLKQLREQHRGTVAQTQALLKEQKALRQKLCQAMRTGPKTIPDIAQAAGVPADQALWHITAMKRYGLIVETGQCGDYYLYGLAQEQQT
jgi:hypothetical protein